MGDLHCWLCERRDGDSTPIALGDSVYMFKAGPSCHVTTNDPNVAKTTYLLPHPEKDDHHFRPYRMHCISCKNQLGIMVTSNGEMKPSFQKRSVIFKDEKGEHCLMDSWKNEKGKENRIIPVEKLGYHGLDANDAKYFICDPSCWQPQDVITDSPRNRKDMDQGRNQNYPFSLNADKKSFTVDHKNTDIRPEYSLTSQTKIKNTRHVLSPLDWQGDTGKIFIPKNKKETILNVASRDPYEILLE